MTKLLRFLKLWPFEDLVMGRLDVDVVFQIEYEIKGLRGKYISPYFCANFSDECQLIKIPINLSAANIINITAFGAYKNIFSQKPIEIVPGYFEPRRKVRPVGLYKIRNSNVCKN